jgi:hypothetical protein
MEIAADLFVLILQLLGFGCELSIYIYMLRLIREIAHFLNWPNFCPLNELASTLAHFTNWAILCSFSAHFMNWADLYVAF